MSDISATAGPRPTRTFRPVTEPVPKRILIVDDEEAIRLALGKFLRSRGYEVMTADCGPNALQMLAQQRYTLMLCDVRMPGMSGIEVVTQAAKADADLAIMMLTAVNDAPTATEALSHGAMDYLMKPIELEDLNQAVERALHKRELTIEQRNVERKIREEVALRTEELEKEKATLRGMTVTVAEALINAMEAKDVYLRGHSQRVGDLAASIADAMALEPDVVEHVRLAGRLQDVGKIGLREAVLNKPDKLTWDEFEHIKDHVRIGVEILAPLQHLGVVIDYVRDHHEHFDGTGYPRALKGYDISIGGRILAAADAFDALTSRRAYRDPISRADSLELLRAQVGRLLDPHVFAALERVVKRGSTLVFIDAVQE